MAAGDTFLTSTPTGKSEEPRTDANLQRWRAIARRARHGLPPTLVARRRLRPRCPAAAERREVEMFQRIVVSLDGSELAERALPSAQTLAALAGRVPRCARGINHKVVKKFDKETQS